MNDNHQEETERQIQDEQPQNLHPEHMLEARISHALQKQAAQIQFTGELRTHIMQNLPARHTAKQRRFLAPAFALAASDCRTARNDRPTPNCPSKNRPRGLPPSTRSK